MSIQLAFAPDAIALPDDLMWSDEFSWLPVEQSSLRTVTGSLVVSTGFRNGGRPITLTPEDDRSAWISRADLETLRTWASVPGRQMTLTLRGTNRNVIFRHQDGSPVDARPIVHYSDVDGGDWYSITLRFQEV